MTTLFIYCGSLTHFVQKPNFVEFRRNPWIFVRPSHFCEMQKVINRTKKNVEPRQE